jgi:Tfp pilus assembly protein PilF
MLENLERLLERGKDGALLRFSIAGEYLKRGDAASAVAHLRKSVALDPKYSAGWKLLGKACEAAGQLTEAEQSWREGVRVSEANGDLQAAKEMKVFLKRLERQRQKD